MEETKTKFSKEIFDFKNYPNLIVFQKSRIKEKFILLFITYCLIFLLIILSRLIISTTDFIVSHLLNFENIDNQDTSQLKSEFAKFGLIKGALVMCLLGPLIEETIFRLPLSLNRYYIALALSMTTLSGKIYTLQQIEWQFVVRLMIAILLFLIFLKWIPVKFLQAVIFQTEQSYDESATG